MQGIQILLTKCLDAEGITIMSSDNMNDKVLDVAKDIILKITSKRPEIREALSIYQCLLVAPGDSGESVAAALGLDENNSRYKYGCTLPPPQYPKVITQLASVVEWEDPIGSGIIIRIWVYLFMNWGMQ